MAAMWAVGLVEKLEPQVAVDSVDRKGLLWAALKVDEMVECSVVRMAAE